MTDLMFFPKKYVENELDTFENVSKTILNAETRFAKNKYIILDYKKILNTINNNLDGYIDYKKSGEKAVWDNNILDTVVKLYNSFFDDIKKYRGVIQFKEFKDVTSDFLDGTNKLKEKLDKYSDMSKYSGNVKAVLKLTDNVYKRLCKYQNMDMKIYLFEVGINAGIVSSLPKNAYDGYNDMDCPCMHKYDEFVRKHSEFKIND